MGLLVVDRVALALARNCRPEELIVWGWNAPGEYPVVLPGNMGRGAGELCVSEAVLPNEAVKSVQVEKLRGRTTFLGCGRCQPLIRST